MATNTYVALDKVTVSGSSTSSITFNSISSGYTDLVVVASVACSVNDNSIAVRFNSDTGSNYSDTALRGNGSAASSVRNTSITSIPVSKDVSPTTTLGEHNLVFSVMNYSNSTTYKTTLSRSSSPVSGTYVGAEAVVGLWRSTSAITSVTVLVGAGVFSAGSTFSLYGIKAEGASGTKATGGAVYSDSTYFYHVFGASGTFTPTQSLTADILVVAGGGGAAHGGGGAGGLLGFTSQSLSATGYTCTVGAGGAGASSARTARGTNGVDSQFGALTLVKGGGGGGQGGSGIYDGLSGASGGGGAPSGYGIGAGGAASPSGQGNAGGGAGAVSGFYAGGGGGGAGAAGATGNSTNGTGTGGNGSSAYSSWLSAIGVGQNVSGTYYIAGGGGGGSDNGAGVAGYGGGANGAVYAGLNAVANTGGGGGGSSNSSGGNGGSGVVIIRYAK